MRKNFCLLCPLLIVICANVFSQEVPNSPGPAPYVFNNAPQSQVFDAAVGTRYFAQISSSPTFQFGKGFLESCTITNIGAAVPITFPGGLFYRSGTVFTWNQSSPYQIWSIDTVSGVHTFLFNLTGVPQANLTGITWDGTTLYGVSTNLTFSQIFTINGNVCTPIGTTTTVCAGAIFLAGRNLPGAGLFSVDIVLDNLYKWNKTTGVATLVGPLGGNANFGQDGQFDNSDGKLYWMSYITGPALRTIDTVTGGGVQLCTYLAQGTGIATFTISAPPSVTECQGFNTATFPPPGWTLTGTDSIWNYDAVSGFGNGIGSAKADFYIVSSGAQQLTPTLFWRPTTAGDSLIFQNAYCTFTNENDQLQILTTSNNGSTWVPFITLNGGINGPLVTAPPQTTPFVPTSAQWKYQRFHLPINTNGVRFNAITAYGNNLYIDSICFRLLSGIVGSNNITEDFSLSQNYPNPFNPSTQISFSLPKAADVKLVVFDILGREVMTLVNEFRSAGNHNVEFNASALSSGIYFYRLETDKFTDTKKMLMIK